MNKGILNKKISAFSAKVYEAATRIPKGKVTTYGKLAERIGNKGAARAVGQALHNNPFAPKVPCHRIVRSDGGLGGFASGTKKKEALLATEGIIIRNGYIDLDRFGY